MINVVKCCNLLAKYISLLVEPLQLRRSQIYSLKKVYVVAFSLIILYKVRRKRKKTKMSSSTLVLFIYFYLFYFYFYYYPIGSC